MQGTARHCCPMWDRTGRSGLNIPGTSIAMSIEKAPRWFGGLALYKGHLEEPRSGGDEGVYDLHEHWLLSGRTWLPTASICKCTQ